MSFDVGTGEILTFIVTLAGVIGTYLGIKATTATQKETSLPAGWQALTQEMKSYFQEQIEQRDKDLAEDRRRIEELEAREEERSEYLSWVTRMMRTIESWAAKEGLTLPPPPFKTFQEWRRDRPHIRNPPAAPDRR